MTKLHLDWESASEIDLTKRGLDVYSADETTRLLMGGYAFDDDAPKLWLRGDPMPPELVEAIQDPHVEKWAFNAQFERVMAARVGRLKPGYKNWRCAMVLGFMQSFVGNLEKMGQLVGLSSDLQKMKEGKRLVKQFTQPQKVTKANPYRWRDEHTDPDDWQMFCEYCVQDVISERAFVKRLSKFPILPEEWDLYELDQQINDRGLPIDMVFVENAQRLATERKLELTEDLKAMTGLANPNSPAQLLGWLKNRGYPFDDLRKDTVKKVLTEEQHSGGVLTGDAVPALKKRQQVARTSVKKYDGLQRAVNPQDHRLRFAFQFGGASRTNRWAGRIINPQNLTRTPKEIEPDDKFADATNFPADYMLNLVTEMIRKGELSYLALTVKEPMDALAGTVRSAIRPAATHQLMSCDLSSIETCVIAWVSGCERLLNVFRTGKDAYKDFGQDLFGVPYDEVTKSMRTDSKPGVLGCGFRLSGGELKEGKKTGLWGYAESMGINLDKDQCHKAVRKFREIYPQIPKLWYALEEAIIRAIKTGGRAVPIIRIGGSNFRVPVEIEMMKPYMTIKLPSGRRLYYHKPRVDKITLNGVNGEYTKEAISYMGQKQGTKIWTRLDSHGGKFTENIVQAIARDILAVGIRRAMEAGFNLVGHVHDELIVMIRRGDNRFTVSWLRDLMTQPEPWMGGLPLGAAGGVFDFYRKD
jgi:DNA polymerase bacteriophage-type